VIGRRLIHRQPQEPLDGQAIVGHHLRLAFGEVVQIGDQQHLQNDRRVVGGTTLPGLAPIQAHQPAGEAWPGNQGLQLAKKMVFRNDTVVEKVAEKGAAVLSLETLSGHGGGLLPSFSRIENPTARGKIRHLLFHTLLPTP
jgi:hypothetical protein